MHIVRFVLPLILDRVGAADTATLYHLPVIACWALLVFDLDSRGAS